MPLAPGTVPNYLVQSILVTLCCCIPFGIVAIVFSAQVNGKLTRGDYEGAVKASDRARKWAWISFGSGIAVIILYFYWVLLLWDCFAVTKPLSQIQRSTLWPLQDANQTPSFGGFGLKQ